MFNSRVVWLWKLVNGLPSFISARFLRKWSWVLIFPVTATIDINCAL